MMQRMGEDRRGISRKPIVQPFIFLQDEGKR